MILDCILKGIIVLNLFGVCKVSQSSARVSALLGLLVLALGVLLLAGHSDWLVQLLGDS